MTGLLTDAVRALGRTAGDLPLTTGVPIVAFLLLVVLATEREMARFASRGPQARRFGSLAFVLVPLALVFLSAVTARFVDLLT